MKVNECVWRRSPLRRLPVSLPVLELGGFILLALAGVCF